MKKQSALFLLAVGLSGIGQTTKPAAVIAISVRSPLACMTRSSLPCLFVSLLFGGAGYFTFQHAKGQYETIDRIIRNPMENKELIRQFCYNYKKNISMYQSDGKTVTGAIEDNSLALNLINTGDNPEKFKEFALYVSSLMRKDADANYFGGLGLMVMSALAVAASVMT